MLSGTLLGALCMVGTLWLAGPLRRRAPAPWPSRCSRLRVVAAVDADHPGGHHAAVVPAAADPDRAFVSTPRARSVSSRCRRRSRGATQPKRAPGGIAAAAAVGSIGALTFSQDIPDAAPRHQRGLTLTPTVSRGSRRPPGPGAPSATTARSTPRSSTSPGARNQTVVLTADYSLSYYPYYGFQGLTSHYANPLAQFDERAPRSRTGPR